MSALLLFTATLVVGCTESTLTAIDAELVVTPALTTLRDVPIGGEAPFALDLYNPDSVTVRVLDVFVDPVDGAEFEVVQLPEEVVGSSSESVGILFRPTGEGYLTTRITVVSNAKEPEITVDFRGHAGAAALVANPPVLDFGSVLTGELSSKDLSLVSSGTVSPIIEELRFASGSPFSTPAQLPVQVEWDGSWGLKVTFAPAHELPVNEVLSVMVAGLADPLLEVPLRGNDCEGAVAELYDVDDDGVTGCAGDCNDRDATSHPGGVEACDGFDDDCDGTVDEHTECFDDDGDGQTERGGDCNDGLGSVHTGAAEVADGVDNDCDGVIDDGVANPDNDGDGYTPDGNDCDDRDATVYPGATELADSLDNDCDGTVDEGTTWHDDDGDGRSEAGGDCDDTDTSVYTAAAEVGDGKDNDCDGAVDEGTSRADDDGDGFTEDGGDCNDADAAISPAALEVYGNGIDDDCDGVKR